jgi:uncharacterized protein involved in tolerance to divalent cations
MIALHIETSQPQQAQAIAKILLDEHLIDGVNMYNNVPAMRLIHGIIEQINETVIVATTQQKFYTSIEKRLRDFCAGQPMPVMYTTLA